MFSAVQGMLLRFSVTFKDLAGVPADPSTVTFSLRGPDGVTTSFTYGVDPEIIRDSAGVFHTDALPSSEGEWKWRWQGTGAVAAATEGGMLIHTVM